MNEEENKCDFCGQVKSVGRIYVYAGNKDKILENDRNSNYFLIVYYCIDCGEPSIRNNNLIEKLVEELRKDKSPGSYYHSWQSNIAMSMYDELDGKITKEEANRGAVRFLELLTNHQP